MAGKRFAWIAPWCLVAACAAPSSEVASVALRVHHVEKMTRFYREAFGVRFREVDTFGVTSRFGELDGMTIKLVPIRGGVDFEGYNNLQLGIVVRDVRAVVEIARRCGGRQEGEIHEVGGELHAAVRDPDGNTIELYTSRRVSR